MAPSSNIAERREFTREARLSLQEHLIELRSRLLWCALGFAVAFLVCYHFSQPIYLFLADPLAEILREKGEQPRLIYTALYEAFFTYIKVSAFGAIFISFPLIVIQVWRFIAPGLYSRERRAFLPFMIATPVLFILGAALAYYFVLPVAWRFFLSFETPLSSSAPQIQLQAKVGEYLSLVMKLILAFGLAFELPVLLSLCARVGFATPKGLRKYRRYSYVGCFVVAAVLTPPDLITMSGLAIPLIILYEISIVAATFMQPKGQRL